MEEEGLPALPLDESTNKWNALPCLGEETCCLLSWMWGLLQVALVIFSKVFGCHMVRCDLEHFVGFDSNDVFGQKLLQFCVLDFCLFQYLEQSVLGNACEKTSPRQPHANILTLGSLPSRVFLFGE